MPETGAASRSARDPRLDLPDVVGEPVLWSTPHRGKVGEDRDRCGEVARREVHGLPPEATLPDLARLPQEPPEGDRRRRLLHRADRSEPIPLRVPRSRSRWTRYVQC